MRSLAYMVRYMHPQSFVSPLSILRFGSLAILLMASIACSDDGSTSDFAGDVPDKDGGAKRDTGVSPEEAQEEAPKPAEQTPAPQAVMEADVDTIEWKTGTDVGFGVASKDTGNPRANNAAIIYAGDGATLDGAKGWATALYKADLKERGVRHLFAVQAPSNATYTKKEIFNSKISAALLPQIDDKTKFILLVAHSSGTYVAHEFLDQVTKTRDPDGKMNGKLVYFNLDGTVRLFTDAIAAKVKKTYWVSPRDNTKNTGGLNPEDMVTGGQTYANIGATLPFEAAEAGCNRGATGCVHASIVINKPHNPAEATPDKDYDDYADGRSVVTKYLADKAAEAGLAP
jgi:hypothetical protein